ncbi:immunoglobulin superfamily member 3-like [Hirundo rustica]|uniref:immunoglobulin superfamily member 3-like n=1 Tax=Hirundo rustica TaxID=43150 RepID=UPI001A9452E2|nr:immunoglobulin superfamily member 3-like [Hirundo rustica]
MVPCCFLVAVLAPLVVALEQSPDMVIKEGQSVNLECSQKKSSNTAMYWFMRPSEKNSSLTLLVTAIVGGNAAVEKGFESHFKSSDIKGDSITLTIERAFLNDSGTYYCAESEHSGWAIQQSPDTVVRVGDTVTLECSASGKDFINLYWYKVPMEKDAGMQLVVYSMEGSKADIEEEFKNRFQSDGTKNNHLSVRIQHVLLNDTGTYFCAEQDPQ